MSTNVGTRLAIATGLPATFNETGYEALTWVEIGGLVSVGETGSEDEAVPVGNVTTGRISTIKGGTQGITTPVVFRTIEADAGQVAVIAACGSRAEFSWRVGEPGTIERYHSGPAMNLRRLERTTNSYQGMSFDFVDNYGEVSGT
jgi:hypothetical protein